MRVDLLEASLVGIGAYPDAHFNFKLLDALSKNSYLSNERRIDKMTEETQTEEAEVSQPAPEESPAEPAEPEVAPAEEPAPAEEGEADKAGKVEQTFSSEQLALAVKEAVKEVLSTQRGLVDREKTINEAREELKKKSLGELAIAAYPKIFGK